ncbi:MAG: hypothetical protein U0Q15_11655 [Kineosporiaceae bacterium]
MADAWRSRGQRVDRYVVVTILWCLAPLVVVAGGVVLVGVLAFGREPWWSVVERIPAFPPPSSGWSVADEETYVDSDGEVVYRARQLSGPPARPDLPFTKRLAEAEGVTDGWRPFAAPWQEEPPLFDGRCVVAARDGLPWAVITLVGDDVAGRRTVVQITAVGPPGSDSLDCEDVASRFLPIPWLPSEPDRHAPAHL